MSNSKHQSTLKYVKSTKGSHVYGNGTFPAVYIPKVVVAEMSNDGSLPQQIELTLTPKEN